MHTVHGTIRGSCWKTRVRLTLGVETTKDIIDLLLSLPNHTVSSYDSFSSSGVTKCLVMKLITKFRSLFPSNGLENLQVPVEVKMQEICMYDQVSATANYTAFSCGTV